LLCMLPATAQSSAESPAGNVTLNGFVSCKLCRGAHSRRGNTQFSCTQLCVSQGSDYVLVLGEKMYGDKIYILDGDKKLFEQMAGGKVTVTGRVIGDRFGDRFEVETIGSVKRK
jgi:hypothetical protein